MARAIYHGSVVNTSGDALSAVDVYVYQPGTTTAITETIYDANGNVQTNPIPTGSLGEFVIALDDPKRVDLKYVSAAIVTRTDEDVDITSLDAHPIEEQVPLVALQLLVTEPAHAIQGSTRSRAAKAEPTYSSCVLERWRAIVPSRCSRSIGLVAKASQPASRQR